MCVLPEELVFLFKGSLSYDLIEQIRPYTQRRSTSADRPIAAENHSVWPERVQTMRHNW